MERAMGIEPTLVAWEATVLPLNYARFGACFRTPVYAVTALVAIQKPFSGDHTFTADPDFG
jgi:hypothetical protein